MCAQHRGAPEGLSEPLDPPKSKGCESRAGTPIPVLLPACLTPGGDTTHESPVHTHPPLPPTHRAQQACDHPLPPQGSDPHQGFYRGVPAGEGYDSPAISLQQQ